MHIGPPHRYISKDAYHLIPESGGTLSAKGSGSTLVIDRRNNEITSSGTWQKKLNIDYACGMYICSRSSSSNEWLSSFLPITDSLNPPASYDQAVLAYGVFGIISLLQSECSSNNLHK